MCQFPGNLSATTRCIHELKEPSILTKSIVNWLHGIDSISRFRVLCLAVHLLFLLPGIGILWIVVQFYTIYYVIAISRAISFSTVCFIYNRNHRAVLESLEEHIMYSLILKQQLGLECFYREVKKREKAKFYVPQMRMLRRMCVITVEDKIRNKYLRKFFDNCNWGKKSEFRFRWLRHMYKRQETVPVRWLEGLLNVPAEEAGPSWTWENKKEAIRKACHYVEYVSAWH